MATDAVIARRAAQALAGHLYDWHAPYGDTVCVYCGEYANTRDHVIPLSYVAGLGDAMEFMRVKFRHGLLLVPSCLDCNVRMSSFVALSLTAKRAELKRRLRRKHVRLLGNYDWQTEEIAELGYNLQSWIKQREAQRQIILRRLRFPEDAILWRMLA